MSYLQLAREIVEREQERVETKIRLVTPMSDARRRSLDDVMSVMLQGARDRIIVKRHGGQYKPTDETKQAEGEVDNVYKHVMDGDATLEDFREALRLWERLA